MASPLNKVGTVRTEDGTVYEGAQLVVRPDGTNAVIRFGGSEVRTATDVTSAGPGPMVGKLRTWEVESEHGKWTVTERASARGGCRSCGGGR